MLQALDMRLSEMDNEDLCEYRSYYCGMCNILSKKYKMLPPLLITFEAVFLSILTDAQRNNDVLSQRSVRCPFYPIFKRKVITDPSSLNFATAATICISAEKLADNVFDEGRASSKIFLKLSTAKISEAKNILESYGFPSKIIRERINTQRELESKGCTDLEVITRPTALGISDIFSHTASIAGGNENKESLSDLGYNLGKVIYLMDSHVDFLRDIKHHSFNPLVISSQLSSAQLKNLSAVPEELKNQVYKMILESLEKIKTDLTNLTLSRYNKIIENILLDNFPDKVNRIFTRKYPEKNKEKIVRILKHSSKVPFFYFAQLDWADVGGGWC